MLKHCAVLVVALGLVVPDLSFGAQAGSVRSQAQALEVHAYTLRHQPAEEAVQLVRPLLTGRGTVTLQPGSNTLQIRDLPGSVSRIVKILEGFDHPTRQLDLEVMLVRATIATVSPPLPSSPELPEELVQRLKDLLRYDTFELVAKTSLSPREGERVTYQVGEGYKVSFRMGTVVADRRVKLHDFNIVKRDDGKEENLLHTHLNMWLEQTLTLGLARDESSRTALMVVMVCTDRERWAAPNRAPDALPPRRP